MIKIATPLTPEQKELTLEILRRKNAKLSRQENEATEHGNQFQKLSHFTNRVMLVNQAKSMGFNPHDILNMKKK